jgi:hypothetical protein
MNLFNYFYSLFRLEMVRNYKRKKEQLYSLTQLKSAIASIRNGTTFRNASNQFHIPLGTLHNHFFGKHTRKVGHPTALQFEEEELIVSAFEHSAANGWPCNRKDLHKILMEYTSSVDNKFPWTNSPGADFLQSFEKRWAARLTLRTPEIVTTARIKNLTKESVEKFFVLVDSIYKKYGIENLPERIYNLDETGFVTDPGVKRCFSKKGVRNANIICPSGGKTMFTVLACTSASGNTLPPCVIYKSKHLFDIWKRNGPQHTSYYASKSGWMEMSIFEAWFSEVSN